MEEPEGVPHVLNDDLKLLISDLIKVSNADNNPEATFETTDCKYYKVHDFNNTMYMYVICMYIVELHDAEKPIFAIIDTM